MSQIGWNSPRFYRLSDSPSHWRRKLSKSPGLDRAVGGIRGVRVALSCLTQLLGAVGWSVMSGEGKGPKQL